jgi:carbon storage regulator
MLVLSRKRNETIIINGDIRIMVVDIRGNQVRLGIEAPDSVGILRQELCAGAGGGEARGAGLGRRGVRRGRGLIEPTRLAPEIMAGPLASQPGTTAWEEDEGWDLNPRSESNDGYQRLSIHGEPTAAHPDNGLRGGPFAWSPCADGSPLGPHRRLALAAFHPGRVVALRQLGRGAMARDGRLADRRPVPITRLGAEESRVRLPRFEKPSRAAPRSRRRRMSSRVLVPASSGGLPRQPGRVGRRSAIHTERNMNVPTISPGT